MNNDNCEICHKIKNVEAYCFYYGKVTSSSSNQQGNQTITKTLYSINPNPAYVNICYRCIFIQKRLWAFIILPLSLISSIYSVVNFNTEGPLFWPLTWTLFSVLILLWSLTRIFASNQILGDELAKENKEREYIKLGFDKLFTEQEYSNLK